MNPGAAQLRFAVLHHTDVAEPHFDLLIELGPQSLLATWRLTHWPLTQSTPIERQPDHRRLYLDYQGPISGGRGQVRRVAGGHCDILANQPDLLNLVLTWNHSSVTMTLTRLDDLHWQALPG